MSEMSSQYSTLGIVAAGQHMRVRLDRIETVAIVGLGASFVLIGLAALWHLF